MGALGEAWDVLGCTGGLCEQWGQLAGAHLCPEWVRPRPLGAHGADLGQCSTHPC